MNIDTTMSKILEKGRTESWERLYRRARKLGERAKKFRADGRYSAARRAYALRKATLKQAILATLTPFRVAGDDRSMLSVGKGKRKLHLARCDGRHPYPSREQAFLRLRRVLEAMLKKLDRNAAPRRADFGRAFDILDGLAKAYYVRLIDGGLRHSFVHASSGDLASARREVVQAHSIVRKIEWEALAVRPDFVQKRELWAAIKACRQGIDTGFVSLPAMFTMFDAIDDWPRRTSEIVPQLKRIQNLSRATRFDNCPETAHRELTGIENDLLGAPHFPNGPSHGEGLILPEARPRMVRTRRGVSVGTSARRLLARLVIDGAGSAVGSARGKRGGDGRSAAQLLADVVGLIGSHGAQVISPRVIPMPSGEARIDVVYDAEYENFEMISRTAKRKLQLDGLANYSLGCTNPVVITVSVNDHHRVTRELTARLADVNCDLVITLPGIAPVTHGSNGRMRYSFTCLASRPPETTVEEIYRALEPVMRRRGGVLVVTEECTEGLLENRFEPTTIAQGFTEGSDAASESSSSRCCSKLLGMMHVGGPNRLRFMNQSIEVLEPFGVRIICPVGMLTDGNSGAVDILYEATRQQQTKIKQSAPHALPPLEVSVTELAIDKQLTFVVSVAKREHVTYRITRALGKLGCELVHASGSFHPRLVAPSNRVRMDYSFTGIVSRPAQISTDVVTSVLGRIANQRGGIAVASEDCAGLLLDGVDPGAGRKYRRPTCSGGAK